MGSSLQIQAAPLLIIFARRLMPHNGQWCTTRTARRWVFLCAFVLISLAMSQISQADGLDISKSFQSEYPLAARKLEDAYKHVRIVGTYTKTDDKGSFLWTKRFEFLREGELV